MGVEEDAVVVNMDSVEKTQSKKYKRNDSLEFEARTPAHARDPKVSEL